ncbi:hypothetical protein KA005_26155, partial [bacterium]|nr:hypothetical protein [bacterium]
VVAIKNDNRTNDKKGMNAYNNLHFVRQEIFKAILGYRPSIEWEQPVTYRGGNLVGLNRGYLWYQYEFELIVSVEHRFDESDLAGNTGVDGIPVDMSQIDDFNTMFIDYVLSKTLKSEASKDLDLPLDADDTHAQQRIDFRESPDAGSFNISLGSGFDFYKGD